MIIYRHESFPFPVANLIQGYEEWYGSTAIRFPEDIFGREAARHWIRHIIENLRPDQKRPFVLAVDDGRTPGFTDGQLRESKCSWTVFDSGWVDRSIDKYQWAWKVLRAWPDVLEKCQAAYDINKQCKLSVSIRGKITIHNL